MTPQRVVLGAWLTMIGLATVRSIAGGSKGLPSPSLYLGSGVLFTALYGAAGLVGPLAAVLAVGIDVAALATPYMHGKPGLFETAATWLDGISGGPSAQPAKPAGATGP
jgi:hypothetical protein